jgi:hypothetical protein
MAAGNVQDQPTNRIVVATSPRRYAAITRAVCLSNRSGAQAAEPRMQERPVPARISLRRL